MVVGLSPNCCRADVEYDEYSRHKTREVQKWGLHDNCGTLPYYYYLQSRYQRRRDQCVNTVLRCRVVCGDAKLALFNCKLHDVCKIYPIWTFSLAKIYCHGWRHSRTCAPHPSGHAPPHAKMSLPWWTTHHYWNTYVKDCTLGNEHTLPSVSTSSTSHHVGSPPPLLQFAETKSATQLQKRLTGSTNKLFATILPMVRAAHTTAAQTHPSVVCH